MLLPSSAAVHVAHDVVMPCPCCAEEDLIMLLAASCAELYKREATVYAPLLAPVRGSA